MKKNNHNEAGSFDTEAMGVFIGTSGFSYKHWEDGVFYPKGVPKSGELEYYCRHFTAVEMNVTFYRMPKPEAFRGWNRRTPQNFHFVLKGSRFITHIKRLKDAEDSVSSFFARSRALMPKTDVILWQLPPRFKADPERLQKFIKLIRRRRSVRHAFEFRDESWFTDEIFSMVREARMTICRADWPWSDAALPDDLPFEYVRRHGPPDDAPYAGCYTDAQIEADAKAIRKWRRQGKDVYVFYNNDGGGHAVRNALRLKRLLK